MVKRDLSQQEIEVEVIELIDYLYGLFKDGSDMLAELEADHAAEIESEWSKWGAGTAVEFNAILLTGNPELINLQGIVQIEALSRHEK